jgi:hypothetical protein
MKLSGNIEGDFNYYGGYYHHFLRLLLLLANTAMEFSCNVELNENT